MSTENNAAPWYFGSLIPTRRCKTEKLPGPRRWNQPFLWSTELLSVWGMSMNEERSWGREYKGHWKIILASPKEINIESRLFVFWNSGRKGRHRTRFRWLWKEPIAKFSSDHNTLHVVMTDLGPEWARIQRQVLKSQTDCEKWVPGRVSQITDIVLLTTGTDTVYP